MFFFFNDTATTEIYTLSLHDALPICARCSTSRIETPRSRISPSVWNRRSDRKSTRLNSSHGYISYAVFCLKKKTRATGEPDRPLVGTTPREPLQSQHVVPPHRRPSGV